jgi:DNA-directed RNA polymerase subunit RPC12/RpoP
MLKGDDLLEIIQLRYPNCNAELHVENGLDTFYCQHCGTKIVLSEHPDIIRAKADMHIADTNAEIEKARLQHELDLKKFEEEKQHRDTIFVWKLIGILYAILLGWIFLLRFFI